MDTGSTRVLESVILEILSAARPDERRFSFEETNSHLSTVARLDYAAALRRRFDRAQLLQIISEMKRSLPALNQRQFATTDLQRLSEVAAGLGTRLQAAEFRGREGHQLRGFYVDDGMFRRRPLICVNAANHPVAVAAAFWHEVGHHLGRCLLSRHGRMFNFTTDCHRHLNSLSETIADVVMVLAAYPRSAARRLFSEPRADDAGYNLDLLVARARAHVQTTCGFDFSERISTEENLSYLASMIHIAKLRAALFREFEV